LEYKEYYKIYMAHKGCNMKKLIVNAKEDVGWCLGQQQDWGVLVSPKSTSTQSKFTKNISQNTRSMEMYQKLHGQMLKILTSWWVGFLVKPFRLLVNAKALTTQGVHSSLKSLGVHRKNNHAFYCLKMLKGFYLTTKGKLSVLSSIHWMNLGMTSNGKCLTVKTSESPRIGKECSLSDILEEEVDPKYFLSEKAVRGLLKGQSKPQLLDVFKGGVTQGDITQVCQSFGQTNQVHDPKGISPTVPTVSGGRHIPMICKSEDLPQQSVNACKASPMAGQEAYQTHRDISVLAMP